MDPAKQQYIIFSGVIGLILALVINFFFVDLLQNSFLYGFPISLSGTSGIGMFLARVINSVVIGLIMTPLVYFTIRWLQTRQ
jgi:hypothetical protein